MQRFIAGVGAISMCVVLTGCSESEAQKEARIQANMHVLAEKYVKAKLKDPESAQFQNKFIGIKGAACGEVNAKSGFGGYTGFKRYISAGKDLTVLEQDMAPGEFDISWGQICK
jgi:hypothetical protein